METQDWVQRFVVTDRSNLGKGGSNEKGKSGQIQTICQKQTQQWADGLETGCEKKRGIRDDSWDFGLSNQMDSGTTYQDGEDLGTVNQGRRMRFNNSVWSVLSMQ